MKFCQDLSLFNFIQFYSIMTMLNVDWYLPPEDLILLENEVHVWRAPLDWSTSQIHYLSEILTTEEQQRAARFHFERERHQFIVGRGLLRILLGHYLNPRPDKLRFKYGPYGKPSLAPDHEQNSIRFNLSHSGSLVLYAFARKREVGIDVEQIRIDIEAEQIAEHFFSAQEKTTLCNLPIALKYEAFFACWTRKEAYIKAKGEGLSLPLDQFDVSLIPGEPARLLRTHWNPEEADHWSLQELRPDRGYIAALAVEGSGWQLKCWQLQGDKFLTGKIVKADR